ncbi:MAG: TolB family protein [Planctomycetales bacterium]|nr:TolB family protein [Planctomycetales bacterium]
MIRKVPSFLLACICWSSLHCALASADQVNAKTVGQFDHHGDVGAVKHTGSSVYDPAAQEYHLSGAGTNMWFAQDEFQFVWKKMRGDFVLRCQAELLGAGVDPHRKLGWMIRSSLDTDSPYVDLAVHGDGLTSMQFRRNKGDNTEQVESPVKAPNVLQLVRKNNKYVMSVAKHGEVLTSSELEGIQLGDEVYVGLFICSHNADVVEKAIFRNVRVVIPAPDDFRPYRDYIGSRLEVLQVSTGQRRIVHTEPDSLQAPNWTRDDAALIYNRNGKLYRFDIAEGRAEEVNTGTATQNNNDHVISSSGSMLGISNHTGEGRKSVVYTLPILGGDPKRITTPDAHSYLHGWSPDDQFLIYTAQRNDDFDIFRIPSGGGQEVNLTQTAGLDDGSEYTPDGKYIYFNSTRSGLMQIWRMDADGSNQIQITDDEYNNWFPHIAPDGQSMVIISYDQSIEPTDHPFYKHCYLRQLNLDGSQARVIAYVYGGQGTINVPSWSSDSQRLAFVSNSQLD